jgi:hypothetical protein
MYPYHKTNDQQPQRRCSTVLEPTFGGFRGSVYFEDSEPYQVRVLVRRDCLKVSLRSQLSGGADSAEVIHTVIERQSKSEPGQSDYNGWLRRKDRRYRLGAYLWLDWAGAQYLRLYLQPQFAKQRFGLEVVR